MTELQNPLFEEEKEFLERKKLEYERALRGDVEHIKDQSLVAGKVALVGLGLAGGVWLITKAFGGSKKGKRRFANDGDLDQEELDELYAPEYVTDGLGRRFPKKVYHPTAKDSAAVFASHDGDTDDLGFGAGASAPQPAYRTESFADDFTPHGSASAYEAENDEDDPFRDLPYDDSRRLPDSLDFDEDEDDENAYAPAQPSFVGSAVKSFLQSDTGKVLVAQVAAVALALVTKKINDFFPAAKNSDLATSPGYAPAETGFSPVVSSVSLASPDASSLAQSS